MIAMKKCLIKGALALFSGALMFSCAEKETEYVPINEQKLETFEQVFKEVYGEPAPDHDWGFSTRYRIADESTTEVIYLDSVAPSTEPSRARTRTANPDANMWGRYYTNIPDPLTADQKKRVRLYFQYNQYPTNEPVSYSNFFVQDVYKGATTPLNDGTADKSQYSTEKYTFNGQQVAGSAHMDKLTAGTSHDHIYNYNNATCSTNYNVWDGRTYEPGYPKTAQTGTGDWEAENYNHIVFHKDEIMLMENSSTSCFGWYESQGSIQHDDKYVIISGATIDAWATTFARDHEGMDLGASVTGRGFVGFDYEAQIDLSDLYAFPNGWDEPAWDEYIWNPEKNDNDIIHHDAVHHDGIRCNEDGIPYLKNNTNQYSCVEVPAGTTGAYPVWERDFWVTVGCADGYYSDWIVCIVQAQGKTITSRTKIEKIGTDEKYPVDDQCGRIFCEDLGVSSREDLDFNDVVFDVDVYMHYETGTKYYYTIYSDGRKVLDRTEPYSTVDRPTYTAKIKLQAAGGTLPLTVAGKEVHSAFGVGLTTMVNTLDGNSTAFGSSVTGRSPVTLGEFTPRQLFPNDPNVTDETKIYASQIPVVVKYSQTINVLQSKLGGAPAKLFIPNQTTKWAVERKPLSQAYPKFAGYVQDKSIRWWDDSDLSTYLVNHDNTLSAETAAQAASLVNYYRYNNVSYQGAAKPPIVITRITYPSVSQDNLWPATAGDTRVFNLWNLYDIDLSVGEVYPGDRIVFEVSGLKDDSHITVVYSDGNKPYFIDTTIPNYDLDADGNKINVGKTTGVIEVMLDETNADKLNRSKTIQVQGRNFTLTRIGRTLFQ